MRAAVIHPLKGVSGGHTGHGSIGSSYFGNFIKVEKWIFAMYGEKINTVLQLAFLNTNGISYFYITMSKKIDANLLRSYMMGAASPVRGSKTNSSMFGEEIDLHIDHVQFQGGKKDNKYALEYQLEALDSALDNAILKGKVELRIIHGIGKGKLKEEIHKVLVKHPQVKYFENTYHPRYGMGSTIVHFK